MGGICGKFSFIGLDKFSVAEITFKLFKIKIGDKVVR